MNRPSVAIDGRPLQAEPLGGVGRYLTGTIPFLAEQFKVFVLVDARGPAPSARLDGHVNVVELAAPRGLPGLAWMEFAVAPWLRRFNGLFHASFNIAPLTASGPVVLTLHDLAPQLHSEDFRLATRYAWRLNIRFAVRRARVVTTVSQFVRSQILDYFSLRPERVLVAPDALDPLFAPERAASAAELADRLGVQGPYVLALGGAPRRGLPAAIEAWRHANRSLGQAVNLVVVGEPSLESEPGLVSVGFLDDESFSALLAGARALCYPTRYEGFGLPALEAMASGTPVVCGRVASLPEVLGDAACWVVGSSPKDMGDILARLLSDADWYAERREAGLVQARAACTWRDTAAVLAEAYERAWVAS